MEADNQNCLLNPQSQVFCPRNYVIVGFLLSGKVYECILRNLKKRSISKLIVYITALNVNEKEKRRNCCSVVFVWPFI